MKTRSVPFSWIRRAGVRLDAKPFLGGALEARLLIENAKLRTEPLKELTAGHNGGIFNGPKFSRNYVDAQHGVPFLGSSDMLMAEWHNLPYLRRKDAESRKLRFLKLERGMTLISCSGTIGRTVYVRPDMVHMWSSQHIMKVVPNEALIRPGYLFAYLSCRFGVPMVTSGTYGSIIQSIEPEHIEHLPIPRLGETIEGRVHELIERAAALRSSAAISMRDVVAKLPRQLGLRSLQLGDVSKFNSSEVKSSALATRLDAPYHSAAALEVEDQLDECGQDVKRLPEVLSAYFKPPLFKRLWVNGPDHGRQFVSGLDAYRYSAEDVRYVSNRTPNFEQFILKRGWVVFQAAGQIYGLFGQPLFVCGWLENLFCADDMYRLVPHDEEDGAYLYAFFRTPHGQVLIKRQASGNSIPRVWDPHMRRVRVPWPSKDIRDSVARVILSAHAEIEDARLAEQQAIGLVENRIGEAA